MGARIARSLTFAVIATCASVLPAAPTWAWFSSSGSGTAAATMATIPTATAVTAVQTSEGTVRVQWSGASSTLALKHLVQRITSSGATDACFVDAGTRSCDDSGVGPGLVSYRVLNIFRTWTTTSDVSSTITVVDHIPTVTSLSRTGAASTNSATVTWTLIVSEPVTGLSAANFSVNASGLTGASVMSVIGSGTSWSVTASTGSGTGTLGITLASSTGATDPTGNHITVPAASEIYSVRPFTPTAFTISDGGSKNRIDNGDSVALTFLTPIDQSTLCAAWSGTGDHAASDATATVLDGGTGNDSISFSLASCPSLRLGTITLGATTYVSGGSAAFTATITYVAASRTVTVTFRTKSGPGSIGSAGGSPTATFTPDPSLLGTAGVAAAGSITSTGRF